MMLFKKNKLLNIKEVSHGVMLMMFIWSMTVISSLSWNIYQAYQQAFQRAESTALSNFNRDQAFRFWVSSHKGIHIKNAEDNTYTFYDPASFLREVMKDYPEYFDSSIRMVGLKPFNQLNKANEWEKKMLSTFADGEKKYLEYVNNSKPYQLGYFEPLFAQPSCIACHIAYEFKEGDLMGAAGVYIQLSPFLKSAKKTINFLVLSHLIFWAIGYITTVLYGRKTELRIKEYLRLENKLAKSNEQLEQRVEQRTLELSKLSKAVENSPAMVLIANSKGIIEYVNDRFTELTGYCVDDILGKSPSIMKSSRTPDSVYKDLWQTILEGKVWSGELCNIHKDGTEFWVSASISPVFSESGELANFIAVEEDITEKKSIEQAIISAKESAEQANRAKSEFLASMSHELRTPLNAIIGFSQLSEFDNSLSQQQKNNSKQIHKAGKHLLNLVDDVLDLTKIEIGKIKLNLQIIPLRDILSESYDMVRSIADDKKISLEFLNKDCLCLVRADYTRLKQIILNLLSNAIKYTTESGQVRLCCDSTDKEIILSIKDNGSGISKKDQEKLFEPFNRLGKEGGNIQGTGIGLVITKKLINMMNGSLEIKSDVNKGSTFTIRLPKEESKEEIKEASCECTPATNTKECIPDQSTTIVTADTKQDYSSDKSSDATLNIVYVEDNLTNLRLMQSIINLQPGWVLHTATNAEDGIELSQTIQPDVILMDINLPKMNGIEAFHEIKKIESLKNIPVVAVSAEAMQSNIDKAMDAGFTDYITKPVDIKSTVSLIHKIIMDT